MHLLRIRRHVTLYFETHAIGHTPSSLERYLVWYANQMLLKEFKKVNRPCRTLQSDLKTLAGAALLKHGPKTFTCNSSASLAPGVHARTPRWLACPGEASERANTARPDENRLACQRCLQPRDVQSRPLLLSCEFFPKTNILLLLSGRQRSHLYTGVCFML